MTHRLKYIAYDKHNDTASISSLQIFKIIIPKNWPHLKSIKEL